MAAWIWVLVGVGLVCNAVAFGVRVAIGLRERRQRDEERLLAAIRQTVEVEKPGDDELLRRVLERFMDAVVPERANGAGTGGEEGGQSSEAEYEPPGDDWAGASDWTDPFLGIERQTVARLAPGQGIPGMTQDAGDVMDSWREKGEGAFDEWMRDEYAPDVSGAPSMQSWVQPLDLGDGTVVE